MVSLFPRYCLLVIALAYVALIPLNVLQLHYLLIVYHIPFKFIRNLCDLEYFFLCEREYRFSFLVRICDFDSVEFMAMSLFNKYTSIADWIKNPLRRTSEHSHKCNYLNFSFSNESLSRFQNLRKTNARLYNSWMNKKYAQTCEYIV